MPTILTRPPVYSAWNPAELAGPYEPLTLREWEVAVATCSLEERCAHLLREALLEPAPAACERNWKWPVPHAIDPFDERRLRLVSTEPLRNHLVETLVMLWQVLDLAPEVIPGMLRGLLLVGLGARLRQTLAALEDRPDVLPPLQELEQALTTLGTRIEPAPAPPVSTPPAQPRRKRWRLWAA